jgi:hypothetical protein
MDSRSDGFERRHGGRDPSAPDDELYSSVLPVIRRALAVGEGPPWLTLLLRSLQVHPGPRGTWSAFDERLTHCIAAEVVQLISRLSSSASGTPAFDTLLVERIMETMIDRHRRTRGTPDNPLHTRPNKR